MTSGSMWARLKGALQQPTAQNGLGTDPAGEPDGRTPFLRGLAMHGAEMNDVQEDVAAEQRGRIALVGRNGELNQWLLALLREQPPAPVAGTITREGFFVLAALPLSASSAANDGMVDDGFGRAGGWGGQEDDVTSALADVDLLLYLCRATDGWQAEDNRWFARLRVLNAPILPVVVSEYTYSSAKDGSVADGHGADGHGPVADAPGSDRYGSDDHTQLIDSLRRQTGVRPALLCVNGAAPEQMTPESAAAVTTLIERILSLRPRLSIPLAQEAPSSRQMIARRVITTGSLMTALIGAEPIPLLDLPLHVALQWKVALQLAAIYGRPGLDFRSREMVGTISWNLIVRHLAQQLLKFVPGVGWMLSAALSGLSTWLLGNALLRIYADDRRWRLPARLVKGKTLAAQRLDPHRWPRPRLWRLRRTRHSPAAEIEVMEIPIEQADRPPASSDSYDDQAGSQPLGGADV